MIFETIVWATTQTFLSRPDGGPRRVGMPRGLLRGEMSASSGAADGHCVNDAPGGRTLEMTSAAAV